MKTIYTEDLKAVCFVHLAGKHKNIFVDNAKRITLTLLTDCSSHHLSLELLMDS